MSELNKTLEGLLRKSIEVNKTFMEEGGKMLKRYTETGKKASSNPILQNEVWSNAFNQYVDLNVKHIKNLVDLGLNVLKGFSESDTATEEENTEAEPGFVLEQTVAAGETAELRFVLDNVKPETVTCTLVNGAFQENQTKAFARMETQFEPQSFELKTTEARPVLIRILVPEDTPAGCYQSKVQVQGFEPAHFAIQLTITEKKKDDGRKKGAIKKAK
jgi:uncharacterized membrane protein